MLKLSLPSLLFTSLSFTGVDAGKKVAKKQQRVRGGKDNSNQSRVLVRKKDKNKHDKAPAKVDPASENHPSYLKHQDLCTRIVCGNSCSAQLVK